MADVDLSFLSEALDALQEGLQVLSREFRYTYVNDAVLRHGRKSRAELVGKTMMECYPGIERTPMFAALERCMREGRGETMENEFTYDDGTRAWFELRIRPFRDGLVVVSVDVSERKSAETRWKDAYQKALHDLVTPIVRVQRGVLLVPLVGALDAVRASRMTESILERVVSEHAKIVIFDVAALPALDTAVASRLLETTTMLRVLGAKTVVTGMSAATAKTLVHLGVDLSAMQTTTDLGEGIERALEVMGKKIVER